MGRQLVQACNARGVLVDLAHCTGAGVEQALQVSKAPMLAPSVIERVAYRNDARVLEAGLTPA